MRRALGGVAAATATIAVTACGGTSCPPRTSPRGGSPPSHAARWCERDPAGPEPPPVTLPASGPLRVPIPSSLDRPILEGPYTSYYPNGKPESFGSYAITKGRSVPHGMWTFWQGDGSRQSQGRFHQGQPVGCFASWSDEGALSTGVAERGEIRPASCDPPRHEEADMLEARHGGRVQARGDISFQAMMGVGAGFGARSTRYVPADPALREMLALVVRRRLGSLRVGAAAGLRLADADGYIGSTATALGGWSLPSGPVALDAWLELGGLFLWAEPHLEDGRISHGRVFLWTPLAASQVEVSMRVSPRFELTLAGRLELRFPREVERATLFCGFGCIEESDTWSLGGVAPGAGAGARLVLW